MDVNLLSRHRHTLHILPARPVLTTLWPLCGYPAHGKSMESQHSTHPFDHQQHCDTHTHSLALPVRQLSQLADNAHVMCRVCCLNIWLIKLAVPPMCVHCIVNIHLDISWFDAISRYNCANSSTHLTFQNYRR